MWGYSPEQVLEAAQRWWGWQPHPAQREWMLNTHPVKVAACGRRWGKTESVAVETAALAVLYPALRQLIVAPTLDQARILFDRTTELLTLWSQAQGGALQVRYTPYPRVRVNEGEIQARSAHRSAQSLRGRSAHRIVVDEAAYLTPEVIPRVLLPMLADTEGQLVLLSTPFGRNHFWEWFVRGQSGDEWCCSFRFPTATNPLISNQFLQMQRHMLSERQFAIEYEAQFVDDASAVFAQEAIEACVQPQLGETTRQGEYLVAGLDWGRYRDYTAIVIVQPQDNALQVVRLERLPQATWRTQTERIATLLREWHVQRVYCDATGVGDPLVEMLQQQLLERGIYTRVQPVVFSARSKQQVIENLALLMEQRRLAIPPHPDLLRELHAFTAYPTLSGHVRLRAAGNTHDDLVTALALAVYETPKELARATSIYPVTSGRLRQAAALL